MNKTVLIDDSVKTCEFFNSLGGRSCIVKEGKNEKIIAQIQVDGRESNPFSDAGAGNRSCSEFDFISHDMFHVLCYMKWTGSSVG